MPGQRSGFRGRLRSMAATADIKHRFQLWNLLSILAFLRPYPSAVVVCIGLLLLNISIEMTLPQILGNAITGLRQHIANGAAFSVWPFVLIFLGLVVVRMVAGFILG